jgi:dTMP kinase
MKNERKGLFIVFEGNDGSGKTTQIDILKEKLIPLYGDNIVFTREPGGIDICEQIRTIIMDDANDNMDPHTELMLFAASRVQLIADVIRPALDADKIVVCDRYTYSTVAYQGFGRGLDMHSVKTLNQIATDGLEPDVVIWLESDPESALARRGADLNRMDKNGLEFNQRVEFGYGRIYINEQQFRHIPIGPIELTAERVWNVVIYNISKWENKGNVHE